MPKRSSKHATLDRRMVVPTQGMDLSIPANAIADNMLSRAYNWWYEPERGLCVRQGLSRADIHHISMGVADEYRDAGADDWIPSREARELATQPGVLFPDKVQGVDGETFDDLRELVQFYGLDKRTTPYTGRELYERLAGEAESRAVQDRMNMSMDQRRALFPEYARRNDLIVKGLMSGGN